MVSELSFKIYESSLLTILQRTVTRKILLLEGTSANKHTSFVTSSILRIFGKKLSLSPVSLPPLSEIAVSFSQKWIKYM